MKVTVLGAGNVATQLALAIKKAGHEIVQVYNRSNDAGAELAKTVNAGFTSDLKELQPADIYIVAVKDDAIAEVAATLRVGDRVVAHTSGTKTQDLLEQATSSYGIFYPLQTMTKTTKVDFKEVPFLIEASNKATANKLEELARSISKNVHQVDEQQRQWIHLAAVFANNFTNHLFGISEELLAFHDLQFDILKPLIFKAIENLQNFSPAQLQTGPAARGDYQTIEKHLLLLGDNVRLQQIYKILTDSIIASQHQKQV
ncbi:MAG TPA: DUF2520 domain-containing protein [Chitinophagales bacterium]|nr:DUF2520 domain-containing protein [Chitinophagales bacterium]